MNRYFLPFISLLIPITTSLFGWWEDPHRVVAHIAYERLNPAAKEKVDSWTQALSSHFPSYTTFDSISTFPDDLKDQGIGMISSWHYIDYPYDPTHFLTSCEKEKLLLLDQKNNILTALNEQVATLKNPKATPFAKGWALAFLTHFVGDIHQPMHTTTLYSCRFPEGDRGGGYFKIIADGKTTNLHAFWDGLCGVIKTESKNLPADERPAALSHLKEEIISALPEKNVNDSDLSFNPKKWLDESHSLSICVARKGVNEGEALSKEYIQQGQKVAKERVAIAGYRLAHLLNALAH